MQATWLLAFLLLVPSLANASFVQDAFRAYGKVRTLEEEKLLSQLLPEADPVEMDAKSKANAEALAKARADYAALLEKPPSPLSAWETKVLARLRQSNASWNAPEAETLEGLSREFPRAKRFNLLDWEILSAWFGRHAQQAFLRTTFDLQEIPPGLDGQPAPSIVWVRIPGGQSEAELKGNQHEAEKWRQQWQKSGAVVEVIELSPYQKIDEQAEELRHVLTARQANPAALVSFGRSSAIVYRALDLFPGIRRLPTLTGWVTVDGQLYGDAPKSTRAPASVKNAPPSQDRVTMATESMQAELYRLYREDLRRPPPLVEGFPIVSVVTNPNQRPQLRESLSPEGSAWFLHRGKPESAIPTALPLLGASQQASPALRDNTNEFGF